MSLSRIKDLRKNLLKNALTRGRLMPFVLFIYALFISVGGVMGYMKASSQISLIFGLIFGLLLTTCAVGGFAKRKWAPYLALILTLTLDAFFTYRFLKTKLLMPAGALSLVSFIVLVYLTLFINKRISS